MFSSQNTRYKIHVNKMGGGGGEETCWKMLVLMTINLTSRKREYTHVLLLTNLRVKKKRIASSERPSIKSKTSN